MNRIRWIALIIATVLVLGWWLWWRSPSVQAPRTFAALARAMAEGDAGGVVGRVHGEYDYRAQWPDLFTSDEIGRLEPRQLAFLGLRQLFEHHRDDPIRCAYEVHEVTPQDDGSVAVVATLRLSTASGAMMIGPTGPLERHRFILARDGWSAALFFRGHDPIALKR